MLLRIKKQEADSMEKAIQVYTPYLSTVVFNAVGNKLSKEDAEEIISDVFVMLWKNAERIDFKKGTLRSYIAATARNFALKRLAQTKNHANIDDLEIADPQNRFEENTMQNVVWNAVMSLGEPDSEIFVRYYKYGEKLKDISKATGINVSTIKTKLSRGKSKLKKILSDAEE